MMNIDIREVSKMQKPTPIKVGRWIFIFLGTYAVGVGVFVGISGLALSLSFRSLFLPYVMLLYCGLVFALLMYWVRQSYDRPKSCALRLTLAVFLYLQMLSLVLGFSVIKLGIVSCAIILNDTVPIILVGSAITCVVVYVTARRRLEVTQRG